MLEKDSDLFIPTSFHKKAGQHHKLALGPVDIAVLVHSCTLVWEHCCTPERGHSYTVVLEQFDIALWGQSGTVPLGHSGIVALEHSGTVDLEHSYIPDLVHFDTVVLGLDDILLLLLALEHFDIVGVGHSYIPVWGHSGTADEEHFCIAP